MNKLEIKVKHWEKTFELKLKWLGTIKAFKVKEKEQSELKATIKKYKVKIEVTF